MPWVSSVDFFFRGAFSVLAGWGVAALAIRSRRRVSAAPFEIEWLSCIFDARGSSRYFAQIWAVPGNVGRTMLRRPGGAGRMGGWTQSGWSSLSGYGPRGVALVK
jgi:hypothetical protein